MSRSLLALAFLLAPTMLPAQTAGRYGRRRRSHRSGDGALRGHGQPPSARRRHRARLSGSAAMRRANDWTAERFRAYGLTAALEPYRFGVTWERGAVSLQLVAPFTRAITAQSWAWTAGTGGRRSPARWSRWISRRRTASPRTSRRSAAPGCSRARRIPIWNPDGPAMTARDSADRAETLRMRDAAHRRHVGRGGARAAPVRTSTSRTRSRPPARWARWSTAPRSTP